MDIIKQKEEIECAVCHTDIEEGEEMTELICGHTYHYECILLTYKHRLDTKYYGNQVRKCPYCRNNGGYLELKKNTIPLKEVHKEYIKFIDYLLNDNRDKYIDYLNKDKCLAILKTGKNKGEQCSFKPVNNNFCKRHKKVY